MRAAPVRHRAETAGCGRRRWVGPKAGREMGAPMLELGGRKCDGVTPPSSIPIFVQICAWHGGRPNQRVAPAKHGGSPQPDLNCLPAWGESPHLPTPPPAFAPKPPPPRTG